MLRTFSKVFGLGGARLGWCYGPPDVIDVLNRVRSPFNVNEAAQAAGIAALAEPGWVEKGRAHNAKYRPWLVAELRKLGIAARDGQGNFVLAEFGSAERADAAFEALKARGRDRAADGQLQPGLASAHHRRARRRSASRWWRRFPPG